MEFSCCRLLSCQSFSSCWDPTGLASSDEADFQMHDHIENMNIDATTRDEGGNSGIAASIGDFHAVDAGLILGQCKLYG